MKKLLLIATIAFFGTILSSFVYQDNAGDRLIGVWEPSNGRARVKVEKI
jgi:hypothetical protein